MDFDAYQDEAWALALNSAKNESYLLPGLAAEVGELLGAFAKEVRDNTPVTKDYIAKELGDVLWFVAAIARLNHIDLHYVAAANIEKLQSRKQRGVIQGSGDNR